MTGPARQSPARQPAASAACRAIPALLLVVLPTIAFADLQPHSGQWRHDITLMHAVNCPSALLPPRQQSFDVAMKIPAPFHPTGRGNQDISWTKPSENSWQGEKEESRTGPDGRSTILTRYTVTVHTPDHITQDTETRITLPEKTAVQMGMSGTSCTLKSRLQQHYLGK